LLWFPLVWINSLMGCECDSALLKRIIFSKFQTEAWFFITVSASHPTNFGNHWHTTLAPMHQNAWCQIPQDGDLHSHCHDSLQYKIPDLMLCNLWTWCLKKNGVTSWNHSSVWAIASLTAYSLWSQGKYKCYFYKNVLWHSSS
jgi:hypothetical protein